ncbi:DNA repair protein [Sphingomonas sp. G124]|uniref:DNA repair protein n=1 Tax=Sphingomonas cremea TaxID=2904799 RepID=A0A9X1QQ97_9SPHN|nr:JAB domain-containing protein [Sphingomonas cremea]MCF2515509.1 DNA repair protein [Sphingomonas cremea]
MLYQRAETPALLNGHEAARRFFSSSFSGKNQSREHLLVAHVDSAARCIHVEHYQGDFTSVGLPVRQIVSDAAKFGSAGVVLAHNHPSGDCQPSDSDYRATRRLARAGETIDLAVLDHLVFAGSNCSSMRRMGLL